MNFMKTVKKMPLVQSYDAKGWHLLLLSKKRPQKRSLGDSFTKSAHTCLFPTEQGESGREKNAHVLRGN